MEMLQLMKERHSVRAYEEREIEQPLRSVLDSFVRQVNEESGLHIIIRYDDPKGFDSKLAHYGSFRNVTNYIILAGNDVPDFEERCGYYGEKIVMEVQRLGLNTCWAAMTFSKKAVKKLIPEGERFCMVIALGYGQTQGNPHKGKTAAQVVATEGVMPDWFEMGVEGALLAPTAMNQQKFKIGTISGEPAIRISGRGFYTRVDLGIAAYHFEAASGHCINFRVKQK